MEAILAGGRDVSSSRTEELEAMGGKSGEKKEGGLASGRDSAGDMRW